MPEKSSHPRKQPIRRWTPKMALALLLLAGGVVVNVAAAWVLTNLQRPFPAPIQTLAVDDMVRLADRYGGSTWPAQSENGERMTWFGVEWLVLDGKAPVDAGIWMMSISQTGLPLRLLEGGFRTDPTGMVPVASAHVGNFELLLAPIWPGFIINTLFYAMVLLLLVIAPFAARRMSRRRRGLCEKCAYPIGVSPVCTECGAALRRC